MSGAFDAVLFDIDGTLCEYDRTGSEILPIAFAEVGVDPFFTVTEYLESYPRFVNQGDGVATIRERIFAHFADERGYDPAVGRQVADVYARERDHSNVSLLPGATEVIDSVTGTYPTGIVTNGSPEMQRTKLGSLGVGDVFDPIVFAGYDTPAKPDPRPFRRALSVLGTDPEETLYVGNSLDADVRGARRAGLPVAWLSDGQPDPEPVPEYTIETLHDLFEFL